MTTARQIYQYLDDFAGFSQMPAYDNSGFLIGELDRKVRTALVCLDCTREVIAQAKQIGAQLVICHHPLIFDPLKAVLKGSIVYSAIEADIAVMAIHIPLDEIQNGANYWLCEKLELEPIEPFLPKTGTDGSKRCEGWVGKTKRSMTVDEYAESLAKVFDSGVRYSEGRAIETVVVRGGNGKDVVDEFLQSGYDCFVSSEFRHNQYLDAKAAGVCLIDGTHFATEIHIPKRLSALLAGQFPDTDFYLANEENPVILL